METETQEMETEMDVNHKMGIALEDLQLRIRSNLNCRDHIFEKLVLLEEVLREAKEAKYNQIATMLGGYDEQELIRRKAYFEKAKAKYNQVQSKMEELCTLKL